MDSKIIEIYTSIDNIDVKVGTLFVNLIHQKETYSFQFDDLYLKNKYKEIIDPKIQITRDRQFSNDLFGFIQDAIPDRWGKTLIKRNEERLARIEKRTPRTLFASDYLLAVNDSSRLGALRFKVANSKSFNHIKEKVLPFVFLNKLADLAYDINSITDQQLLDLLSPGSSLGGARPKATIYDQNGDLYIAKFPSKKDEIDIELWEKVTNDLAKLCDINVPNSKLVKSKYGHIYLAKRFDRNNHSRLPYVSMMTILGAIDGDNSNYSYLDLVDAINTHSSSPKEDLHELFKRLAFNIIIHNGDDHLRNHGLIKINHQWRLSPAFDLNLSNEFHGLSLSIDGFTNTFDLKSLLNIAKYFAYTQDEANAIIKNMKRIIKYNFSILANKYHANKNEIGAFKLLFE